MGSEGVKLAEPTGFKKKNKEVAYLRSIFFGFSWAQTLIFTALTSTNEVLGVKVCLERFGCCGFGGVNLAEPINSRQFLGPLQRSTNHLDSRSTNALLSIYVNFESKWKMGSEDVKLAEPALKKKKSLMRYAQSSKRRAQTSTNEAQSFSIGFMWALSRLFGFGQLHRGKEFMPV